MLIDEEANRGAFNEQNSKMLFCSVDLHFLVNIQQNANIYYQLQVGNFD